jgi:hypothetical protein
MQYITTRLVSSSVIIVVVGMIQLTIQAKSFPINETATFAQIAEKVGLDKLNVRRFLRLSMTNRIFKEVSQGVVAHTAASRVLAENSVMNGWVGFCTDDIWPVGSPPPLFPSPFPSPRFKLNNISRPPPAQSQP